MALFTSGERRGLIILAVLLAVAGIILAIHDHRLRPHADVDMNHNVVISDSLLELDSATFVIGAENQFESHQKSLGMKDKRKLSEKKAGKKKAGKKKVEKAGKSYPSPRQPLDQPVN